MPNGSMESRALRQQLRSQLGQGIRETEQVLSQYRAAYPSFDLVDWPAVQDHLFAGAEAAPTAEVPSWAAVQGRMQAPLLPPAARETDWPAVQQQLAGQPVPGVNVHPEVEGPRSPAWIQEQTIEPIEFGSLADPVSQAAFLLAPGALRGTKALLETAGSPGPRLGGFIGERGNLGPVPRSQGGQPLPESAVRTETGELKRLYHGTPYKYADFEMQHMDPEGLYGPGVYMTESPEIAGGTMEEIGRGYAGYASKGYQADTPQFLEQYYAGLQEQLQVQKQQLRHFEDLARQAPESHGVQATMADRMKRTQYKIAEIEAELPAAAQDVHTAWRQGPHVRPVYADLKKPFDIEAPADAGLLKKLDEVGFDYYLKWGTNEPDIATNKDLYQTLLRNLGDKAQVNDWLQANGYDGITHIGGAVTGGQPHRVYIAFSPEHVYPSFNVEGAAR